MNILNTLNIIQKSLVSILTLFISTKLLGKKQISELSLFDYTIGISIGNFTADMILNENKQIFNGIIAIFSFAVIGNIISYLSMKNNFIKNIFMDKPTIIMENGQFLYNQLKKSKVTIDNFLEQARINGYFNIDDIFLAILETNGTITFLPKDKAKIPTKKDLSLKKENNYIPINIIVDSKLINKNISKTNKPKSWFINELKCKGYTSFKNILLVTFYKNTLNIYEKTTK